MSSMIGKVSIPQSLSLIEEEVAKAVFLKQKPNLSKEEKIEIAYLETGVKLAYGFQYFIANIIEFLLNFIDFFIIL